MRPAMRRQLPGSFAILVVRGARVARFDYAPQLCVDDSGSAHVTRTPQCVGSTAYKRVFRGEATR